MYVKIEKNDKVFVLLVGITVFVLSFILILISLLITSDFHVAYREVLLLIVNILFLILTSIIFGITLILLSKPYKKTNPLLLRWMRFSFKIIFPIVYSIGYILGIDKDRIRGQYAQLNNYLIGKERVRVNAKELLLLAPHCIQWTECPHKITSNIYNCKGCGKCKVDDLIKVSEKYGIQLSIVTGGTSARYIINKKKPKGIVAIACERDLSSGIHDVKGIPIIGIINERPEGPCRNTKVDIKKVEDSILYFLQGGEL